MSRKFTLPLGYATAESNNQKAVNQVFQGVIGESPRRAVQADVFVSTPETARPMKRTVHGAIMLLKMLKRVNEQEQDSGAIKAVYNAGENTLSLVANGNTVCDPWKTNEELRPKTLWPIVKPLAVLAGVPVQVRAVMFGEAD